MASIARQPFAPLDGARLHKLTSLKNTQNAIPTLSPSKRKAPASIDADDFENIDPLYFSKRPKGVDALPGKDETKPQTFLFTKSSSTNDLSLTSKPATATPRPRTLLNPKSPAAKLNTSVARSPPVSAPAGRSPTRGKRSGILSASRRRNTGSFARVDPPIFGLSSNISSPAPFSLDAALKGTIPSYASRNDASSKPKSSSSLSLELGNLHEPSVKSDWLFDIHEDTPEQEMTNLLQHSTCVLDISSDEESESRRARERAEGKENVPPADDVSQTARSRASARQTADDMVVEKERVALGEMDAKEFYSPDCDENSVFIVPGDDEDGEQAKRKADLQKQAPEARDVDALELKPQDLPKSAEQLMRKTDEKAPCAAVLEPMEGTGESFEVWESGSAKDEAETAPVSEA
ncbi:hypothetical protein F4780DRAFT_187566 [Xylariomycetidae sp. FL0641]|nr:hypothetical protein F4780DRAFT_187566 [Xylariomycetidae sp. FL0641]